MKKNLLFLIGLLLSLSTFGQSDYSRGFQNGYKIGYCYNDYGCIPPIPPITPIPRIGENQDNYQDGYNRGFKQGLEDKQAKKPSSSYKTEIKGDNSSSVLQDMYNPVEFAQRQHMEKFQAQKEQYEQTEKNISEGMKKYSLEIDGWEDQIGYEELNKKISAIRNGFIELNAAGLNLITPRSSQELMAYKALNEAMDDIRYKSSIWQSQKLSYRAAEKIIYEQIIKKESERTIDIDATKANMRALLNTAGILNRSKLTENLIVYKPVEVNKLFPEENKVKSSVLTVTDRDGNNYKTILIGSQTWMVENLKTTKYNDGSSIPLVTDESAWINLSTPGYCWYDNNSTTYKVTYGALYNWYTVNTGNLCPTGWHIPSNGEWTILINYLGGENVAGVKLKESDAAFPGGGRRNDGTFRNIGSNGYWWSATKIDSGEAWNIGLSYDLNNLVRYSSNKKIGFSVRCVRDY
jgi:uncharacterized protein (TIGR02145 family)